MVIPFNTITKFIYNSLYTSFDKKSMMPESAEIMSGNEENSSASATLAFKNGNNENILFAYAAMDYQFPVDAMNLAAISYVNNKPDHKIRCVWIVPSDDNKGRIIGYNLKTKELLKEENDRIKNVVVYVPKKFEIKEANNSNQRLLYIMSLIMYENIEDKKEIFEKAGISFNDAKEFQKSYFSDDELNLYF